MSDVSAGPGFEIPDYDSIVKNLEQSGNDKLVKVSQILAEAQMTHQVLSNFKGYRDAVDALGKSVFDPVKNEMVKGAEKVNEVVGKFTGGNGSSLAPEDLLKMAKNPKASLRAKLTETTEQGKTKLRSIRKTAQDAIDDAADGKMPKFASKDDLIKGVSDLAEKSNISDKIVQDFQDIVNQRFEAIPGDVRVQLRNMGITDDELKTVVSGQGNRDLTGIVRQKMGTMKYDDPFESGELDIPEEYLGKLYRAQKLLSKLRTPSTETGAMSGDSTLARVMGTGKTAVKEMRAKAQAQVDELTEQPEIVTGKRLQAKLAARSRKIQQKSEIEAADEKEFPDPVRPTIAKPNVQEFSDIPEIRLQADSSQVVTKSMLDTEDTLSTDTDVTKTTSRLQKIKNALEKGDEDTAELDDTGLGDIINIGLGLATVGTLIAGLFEKSKPEPVVVSGEQLGV